jgi:hypothetical protein
MIRLKTVYSDPNVKYQWFKDNTPIVGATGTYYYAIEAGSYSILVTINNCSAQSSKMLVTYDISGNMPAVDLKSQGNIDTICSGSNVLLYVANASSYSATATYVWYENNLEISRGAGMDTYLVDAAGIYSVLVFENNGCLSVSADTISIAMVSPLEMDGINSSESLPLSYGNTGTNLTAVNVRGSLTPYVYTWYKRTTNETTWTQIYSGTTNLLSTGNLAKPTWFKVVINSSKTSLSCNTVIDSILVGTNQVELSLDILSASLEICNSATDSIDIKVTNSGTTDATNVVIEFNNGGTLPSINSVTLPLVRMGADTTFKVSVIGNMGTTIQSGVLKSEIISCDQTELNINTVYSSWKNAGWNGNPTQADEDEISLTIYHQNLVLTNTKLADTICSGSVFNFTPETRATDLSLSNYIWKRAAANGINELTGAGSINDLLFNTKQDNTPLLVTYTYSSTTCPSIVLGTVTVLVIDSIQISGIISSETFPLQYNTSATLSVTGVSGGAAPYNYTWYKRNPNVNTWTFAGNGNPFNTGNLTEPTYVKVEITSAQGYPTCNMVSDSIFINVDQVELKLNILADTYNICNALADSLAINVSNSKPGDATNVVIEFRSEGTLPVIANVNLGTVRGDSDTTFKIGLPENLSSVPHKGLLKAEIISCDQQDANPATIYGSWKNNVWVGNPVQADEDMIDLAIYPNMQLISKLHDTICSGETFSYTPQSNLDLVKASWVRYAVPGINEEYSEIIGSISEVLTNSLDEPVTVIYTCTLQTEYCPSAVTADVAVVVSPKGKLTLTHTPANGDKVVLGTPVIITADLDGAPASKYTFTYSRDVKTQDFNEYKIYVFNENVANEVNVEAVNEYGCVSKGTETFKALYDVPNVITPNETTNTKLLEGYNIQVFNRWGSELYHGNSGWNGRYKGSLVASGTYLYVAHIEQPDGKILTIKRTVYVKY